MNDQHPTQALNATQREAEFWYRRLQEPGLRDKEWLSFLAWQTNPKNQEAFDATATRHECMFRARQRSDANIATYQLLRLSWKRAPLSVLMCLLVAGTLALMRHVLQPDPEVLATGEQDAGWLLEDGSYLQAKAHTRIEMEFDAQRRSMHLRRGMAFFRVAPIAGRPFVVHTSMADIEARGTAFAVSTTERDAEVTVMEGTVSVIPPTNERGTAIGAFAAFNLHASEQVRVSPASVYRMESANAMQSLMWGTTVQFENRSAIDAVNEFTRRSGIEIAFKEPLPEFTAPVSGIFQFDDPIAFAQNVVNKTGIPLQVSRPGVPPMTVQPAR